MEALSSQVKVAGLLGGKDHSFSMPPSELSQVLTEQHQQNCKIKQEIILERQISCKLSQNFELHLSRLETDAVQLAGRLELEAKKNEQLTELVAGTEKLVYSVKKRNSELIRLNQENTDDVLPSLVRKEKKLEYDIDQLIQKHNQSLCAINQAIETVNAARSQRVIYSGIFNSIEKELFQADISFKKLMIQRELYEMRLEKQRKAFEKLLKQTEKKQMMEAGAIRCNNILNSSFRPERLNKKSSNYRKESRSKEKLSSIRQGPPQLLEEQVIYKQDVVKSILNQMQCSDVEEFKQKSETIEKDNASLFQILHDLDNQIQKQQRKICLVEERKKRYMLINNKKGKKSSQIRQMEQNKIKISQETCDLEEQLQNYLESITPLLKMFGEPIEEDVKRSCEVTCKLEQRLNEVFPQKQGKYHKSAHHIHPRLTVLIQECSRNNKPSRLFSRRELVHLSLNRIGKGHRKSKVL